MSLHWEWPTIEAAERPEIVSRVLMYLGFAGIGAAVGAQQASGAVLAELCTSGLGCGTAVAIANSHIKAAAAVGAVALLAGVLVEWRWADGS